jgi:hypothetical protein
MEYNYIINSKETEVDVEGSASEMSVSLDEETSKVSVIPVNEGLLLMRATSRGFT